MALMGPLNEGEGDDDGNDDCDGGDGDVSLRNPSKEAPFIDSLNDRGGEGTDGRTNVIFSPIFSSFFKYIVTALAEFRESTAA